MNWCELILGNLIFPSIIAVIAARVITKNVYQATKVGNALKKHGINKVNADNGKLLKSDIRIMFGEGRSTLPEEICWCFFTGYRFIDTYKDKIRNLVKRGCHIKILLSDPTGYNFDGNKNHEISELHENSSVLIKNLTNYYYNILCNKEEANTFLTRTTAMHIYRDAYSVIDDEMAFKKVIRKSLEAIGDTSIQIHEVSKIVNEIQSLNASGSINIRYYKDEYRMPIMLAKVPRKKDDVKIFFWTNLAAPINTTTKTISIKGYTSIDNADENFVGDLQKSFDYLWNKYDPFHNNAEHPQA